MLVITGCSSHRFYEGEALPKDQVATISVAKSWTGHQLVIKSVDGKEYQTQTADVRPGYHTIHVHANKPAYQFIPGGYIATIFDQEEYDVAVHAVAGRRYIIDWGDNETSYPVVTDVTDK
jgi:hypothetical protein